MSAVKIGYLGPEGTFSQDAAGRWARRMGGETRLLALPSIPHIVAALASNKVDQGVVPMENSIEGPVNLTMDMLADDDRISILGEVVLPVEHFLVGLINEVSRAEVVYSHPQALGQCRLFLARELPGIMVQQASSTAEAARLVASNPGNSLAISSRMAADLYSLKVLRSGIQDFPGNKTRFVVLGYGKTRSTGCDKTSLVLAIPQNRPGGLYRILKEFAEADVNLTRIESRPTKKELGEYLFFLDCHGHVEEEILAGVLEKLATQTALLRILGSYPQDKEEDRDAASF